MLGAVHIRLKPLLQPCRRPRKFVLIVVVSHIQAECRVLVKISVAFRDLLLQLLMPSFKVPMLLASICVVTQAITGLVSTGQSFTKCSAFTRCSGTGKQEEGFSQPSQLWAQIPPPARGPRLILSTSQDIAGSVDLDLSNVVNVTLTPGMKRQATPIEVYSPLLPGTVGLPAGHSHQHLMRTLF